MAVMGILNWMVLILIKFPIKDIHLLAKQMGLRSRPLCLIISQPIFILSCTVTTMAHTVMVMIMSNCTLAMKEEYSFHLSTLVLETHFLAMFFPGFYTGVLIKKYGTFTVSVLGAIVFALSSIAFGLGEEKWNYFSGMILLGLAWNLSFSAGTVMLTDCYLVSE
jgi:membrane protease YdiL (CAAX protease family)